jgi:hypothetical protein
VITKPGTGQDQPKQGTGCDHKAGSTFWTHPVRTRPFDKLRAHSLADLQVTAYRNQMPTHLLPRPLSITLA